MADDQFVPAHADTCETAPSARAVAVTPFQNRGSSTRIASHRLDTSLHHARGKSTGEPNSASKQIKISTRKGVAGTCSIVAWHACNSRAECQNKNDNHPQPKSAGHIAFWNDSLPSTASR